MCSPSSTSDTPVNPAWTIVAAVTPFGQSYPVSVRVVKGRLPELHVVAAADHLRAVSERDTFRHQLGVGRLQVWHLDVQMPDLAVDAREVSHVLQQNPGPAVLHHRVTGRRIDDRKTESFGVEPQ